MLKKITFSLLCIGLSTLISCKSDDDTGYTPLDIETQADFIEVSQNTSVEFNVLDNDINVPAEAQLTFSQTQNGLIEVQDPNNTPLNPADDIVKYISQNDFYGDDVFLYTICNDDGSLCAEGTVTVKVLPVSPVNYNLAEMPYPKLSDYNFFEGSLSELSPVYGVLPYEPISVLFSDYAHKKRFIWMPNNVKANYENDYEILNFPTGTILIKNFFYENVQPENNTRIIETRLMIRKDEGWIFVNYIWNDEQAEAFFTLTGGFTEVNWIQNGEAKSVNYRIPGESECFTCHKSAVSSIPIGVKPQNLNSDYLYEEGAKNQLQKMIDMGYLENSIPSSINTVVDYSDASQPIDLRMRSYVDINCAHCHSDDRHCDYRPLRFAFNETENETNLGVCVDPDTSIPPYTKIVVPSDPDNSLLFFRVSTNLEQYRMPLLGRTLQHEEGVAMIREWINSLTTNCN